MRGRLKNSARLVGLTALRAVAALALLFALVVGIGPMSGHYRTVTVLTGSMAPQMPSGSMAVVVPTQTRDLNVGDVVTFQAPIDGQPVVTHRIVEIIDPGDRPILKTKGDANSDPDPWEARMGEDVVWRRVGVLPLFGGANRLMRSGPIHKALIYGAPLLLLLSLMNGIWSIKPEDEDEVTVEAEVPQTREPWWTPEMWPGWASSGLAMGGSRS